MSSTLCLKKYHRIHMQQIEALGGKIVDTRVGKGDHVIFTVTYKGWCTRLTSVHDTRHRCGLNQEGTAKRFFRTVDRLEAGEITFDSLPPGAVFRSVEDLQV